MVKLIKGTLLSVLVFLATSFITVLLQLNSPLHRQTDTSLNIGFPFVYYKQFVLNAAIIPNSGWFITNLIADCAIIFIVVFSIYWMIYRDKNSSIISK